MTTTANGYFCDCGAYYPFDGGVFAHWNEIRVRICGNCGGTARVLRGEVTIIYPNGPPVAPQDAHADLEARPPVYDEHAAAIVLARKGER